MIEIMAFLVFGIICFMVGYAVCGIVRTYKLADRLERR